MYSLKDFKLKNFNMISTGINSQTKSITYEKDEMILKLYIKKYKMDRFVFAPGMLYIHDPITHKKYTLSIKGSNKNMFLVLMDLLLETNDIMIELKNKYKKERGVKYVEEYGDREFRDYQIPS